MSKRRKAPPGSKPSAFTQSMDLAKRARSVPELQMVLADIAERAAHANSAVAVDSIRSIAEAAIGSCIRYEHDGYVISITSRLPDWDSQKVAYWKIGDNSVEGMRCPKPEAGASLVKQIAKAVAAIDRLNKKGK